LKLNQAWFQYQGATFTLRITDFADQIERAGCPHIDVPARMR